MSTTKKNSPRANNTEFWNEVKFVRLAGGTFFRLVYLKIHNSHLCLQPRRNRSIVNPFSSLAGTIVSLGRGITVG